MSARVVPIRRPAARKPVGPCLECGATEETQLYPGGERCPIHSPGAWRALGKAVTG